MDNCIVIHTVSIKVWLFGFLFRFLAESPTSLTTWTTYWRNIPTILRRWSTSEPNNCSRRRRKPVYIRIRISKYHDYLYVKVFQLRFTLLIFFLLFFFLNFKLIMWPCFMAVFQRHCCMKCYRATWPKSSNADTKWRRNHSTQLQFTLVISSDSRRCRLSRVHYRWLPQYHSQLYNSI